MLFVVCSQGRVRDFVHLEHRSTKTSAWQRQRASKGTVRSEPCFIDCEATTLQAFHSVVVVVVACVMLLRWVRRGVVVVGVIVVGLVIMGWLGFARGLSGVCSGCVVWAGVAERRDHCGVDGVVWVILGACG